MWYGDRASVLRRVIILALFLPLACAAAVVLCAVLPGQDTVFRVADGNINAFPASGSRWWNKARISPARVYIDLNGNTATPQPPVYWALNLGYLGVLSYQGLDQPVSGRSRRITVPTWIVAGALLAYPVLAVTRGPVRRYRRRRRGLCLKCGYDLTGNISGVCPECGTEKESS
jgi:hypothetical protein